jgi:hypothetical protein
MNLNLAKALSLVSAKIPNIIIIWLVFIFLALISLGAGFGISILVQAIPFEYGIIISLALLFNLRYLILKAYYDLFEKEISYNDLVENFIVKSILSFPIFLIYLGLLALLFYPLILLNILYPLLLLIYFLIADFIIGYFFFLFYVAYYIYNLKFSKSILFILKFYSQNSIINSYFKYFLGFYMLFIPFINLLLITTLISALFLMSIKLLPKYK